MFYLTITPILLTQIPDSNDERYLYLLLKYTSSKLNYSENCHQRPRCCQVKKVTGDKKSLTRGLTFSIVTVSVYMNLLSNSVSYGHCTPAAHVLRYAHMCSYKTAGKYNIRV